MDIRVQELLEKIKRDGIEKAEAETAILHSEAEEKRNAIIAAAEKEAKSILARAKSDAERFEAAGRAALMQASRDLVLAFRIEIEKVLRAIVHKEMNVAFDADTIKKVLPSIIEAWGKNGQDDLVVLLSDKDLKEIDAYFRDKLGSALKKGLELRPLKDAKAGFRIIEKGGAAYYDFSAEALADMLGAYLNTNLAAIVSEAVADTKK